MAKDYYLILGVSSQATAEEIKAAFRRRALELHPDRSGLESQPFREAREAYDVLSNPKRRRRYDRQREARQRKSAARRTTRPRRAEPLIARRRKAESFAAPGRQRAESFRARAEAPSVVVTLTPEEARRGGALDLEIPARTRCPVCAGRGVWGWGFPCPACGGRGVVSARRRVRVAWPPGVRHGDVARVAGDDSGVANAAFLVHFQVRPDAP